MLSTHTTDNYPFGSVVPYVVSTDASQIIIQVAQIAEHYKNLKTNPKSTLLIVDPFGMHEPMKYPRATIFISWHEAQALNRDLAKEQFQKVIGENIPPDIEPSFSYFIGEIEKIRWIGGFAKVGWVSKQDYSNAQEDPISRSNHEIVTHMNEDHADAVQEIARYYSDTKKSIGAKMIQVNKDNFYIRTTDGQDLECKFNCECLSSEEVRSSIIKLLKSIRREQA
jgi:putative heme iron utilization protein